MTVSSPADLEEIAECVRRSAAQERPPVLVSGQPVTDALRDLVPGVGRRVHMVRATGALRSDSHQPLAYYYTQRPNLHRLHSEDEATFAVARDILRDRAGTHISISSPINLLKEIFTVKGAGTVIRRGSVIAGTRELEGVDRERLLDLLGRSFGKPLSDTAFMEQVRHTYLDEEYRGAALLESHPFGDYLSKFAVGTEARGEGLAQELWQEVTANHPRLFWRCREQNAIRSWYEKQADGRQRMSGWWVFWRGIEPGHVPDLVAYCRDRPPDFEETPAG
jgi:acetylglutamate synthase